MRLTATDHEFSTNSNRSADIVVADSMESGVHVEKHISAEIIPNGLDASGYRQHLSIVIVAAPSNVCHTIPVRPAMGLCPPETKDVLRSGLHRGVREIVDPHANR
jgi:hypothetical protein